MLCAHGQRPSWLYTVRMAASSIPFSVPWAEVGMLVLPQPAVDVEVSVWSLPSHLPVFPSSEKMLPQASIPGTKVRSRPWPWACFLRAKWEPVGVDSGDWESHEVLPMQK